MDVAKRVLDALAAVSVTGQEAMIGERRVTASSPGGLRLALADALYEHLHVGGSSSGRPARDREFERALIAAAGPRTIRILTTVHAVEADRMLVDRDGVRVWLPAEPGAAPGGPIALAVDAIRPALSPGFLVVDGPAARPPEFPGSRVYVHLTRPPEAPRILSAVLDALDAAGIPYRVKVLSDPALYPRKDGLVVYLGHDAGQEVVGDAVRGLPGIGATTSAFARLLRPGVAVADEPADHRPGMRGRSFGEHRALAAATALLHSAESGVPRESALRREFRLARIDPGEPGRNIRE
ncbi:T3SS effector HopA1 family protein [Amycolatopsis sp. NPDC059021]|uniref:T3SS effector HopA1 family protein n=1 Tax=Amycolatopsis sp. NPDC059021 TaxID=3346704 RepID=UPI003670F3BD